MGSLMSGRKSKAVECGRLRYIDNIKLKVMSKMSNYVDYIERTPIADLTPMQLQHLMNLYIKHTPDEKKESDENTAMSILERMAIEGAKTYARIKAERTGTMHARIIEEASAPREANNDGTSSDICDLSPC